jgi:hypothetical protein
VALTNCGSLLWLAPPSVMPSCVRKLEWSTASVPASALMSAPSPRAITLRSVVVPPAVAMPCEPAPVAIAVTFRTWLSPAPATESALAPGPLAVAMESVTVVGPFSSSPAIAPELVLRRPRAPSVSATP